MTHLLEPVGLSGPDSAVYLHLLSQGHATLAELSSALPLTGARLRRSLDCLVQAGLCNKLVGRPVRYIAAPPEVALDSLALHHHQQLDELRAKARELSLQALARGATHEDLIELIQGREAVLRTIASMELGAREEVLIIDCPPHLQPQTLNTHEIQALKRGVRYRAIYEASQLSDPARLAELEQCREAGEQARALAEPGMKMLIVDGSRALIPISFSTERSDTRLLVRSEPLMESLMLCFETLWQRATPLGPAGASNAGSGSGELELDERDRRILQLLATGAKDRAIARALGVNERTVVRRVADLLRELHADTRFQAGVQAARRGLL